MFFEQLSWYQLLQCTFHITILFRFISDVSQCNRTLRSLKNNDSDRSVCNMVVRALGKGQRSFLQCQKLLGNTRPQSTTVPQHHRPLHPALCVTPIVRSRSRSRQQGRFRYHREWTSTCMSTALKSPHLLWRSAQAGWNYRIILVWTEPWDCWVQP